MNLKAKYIDEFGFLYGNLEMKNSKFILDFDNSKFVSEDLTNFQRFQNNQNNRIVVDEYNRIINCKLCFKFPINIFKDNIENDTFLQIELKIGTEENIKSNRITEQKLIIEKYSILSNSSNFDFEKLKNKLPKNWSLKCCYNCEYSDFGVYSNPFFGFMICFKNYKNEYSKVIGKDENYMNLLDKVDKEDFVYETFKCSEFKIREKNVGYRG